MPAGQSLPQNGFFEHASVPEPRDTSDAEETIDLSLAGQYLCTVCQRLRARIVAIWTRASMSHEPQTFNERLPHHNSTYALTEGYLRGCTFCALIWHSLSNVHRRKPTLADLRQWRQMWTHFLRLGGSVDLLATGNSNDELILWPRFTGPRGEVSSVRRRCYLSVVTTTGSPQPRPFTYGNHMSEFSGAMAPPISTDSHAIVEHTVRMLEECHRTHDQCTRIDHSALPTRLLEICGDDKVRLVPGLGMDPSTRYTTLSYCWGTQRTSSVMQLTRDMLPDFENGFAVERLPKTIREAIHFTRRIDIRHMWVDLLCIIQDSPEDKNTEIQAMSSIYEGSHLTICALGAESMEGGLYSLRNPLLYSSIPLTESTDGKRVDVRFKMSDDSWWWWPAHKRGWIYQERILSRRMLSFGPYMVWNCRQTTVKEFDIAPSYSDSRFVLSSQLYRSLVDPEPAASGEDRPITIYKAWHQVLHNFHFTELRFKSDRLAAVTGVISLIRRQTGWDNISGLWEPFLLRELLWEPSARPVLATGLAPSWSWIAWDGRIHFKAPEFPSTQSGVDNLAIVQRAPDIPITAPGPQNATKSLPCLRLDCVPLKVLSIRRKENIPHVGLEDWPFPGIVQYTPDGEETDRAPEFFLPCMWDDMYVQGLMVARSRHTSPAGDLYDRVGFLKALKGQKLLESVLFWNSKTRKAFQTKILEPGRRQSFLLV